MASDTHTRSDQRAPVTLKIKFKSANLDQFIERYSVDVSHGGIFIRTKDPLAVGTRMRFEFQLRDATPLIRGEGTVVWTRERNPERTKMAPGMGVRFDILHDTSQDILDQILDTKQRQLAADQSSAFSNQPTKVAPREIVEDLASNAGDAAAAVGQNRYEGSDVTPLPPPTPFHSDMDEFAPETFEEATKVAHLDELAAQSIRAGLDEDDAFLRAPTGNVAAPLETNDFAGEPVATQVDKNPVPPAAVAPQDAPIDPGLFDDPRTTQYDRTQLDEDVATGLGITAEGSDPSIARDTATEDSAASERPSSSQPVAGQALDTSSESEATQTDFEPPGGPVDMRGTYDGKRVTGITARPEGVRVHTAAVATKQPDGDSGGSKALALLLALLLLGGGAAAFYFLVLAKDDPGATTAPVNPRPRTPPTPPKVETFDVQLKLQPTNAVATLEGTGQRGSVFKDLDTDKEHVVVITLPGYGTRRIKLDPVQREYEVNLVELKKVFRVTSEPPGAVVYINGRLKGNTPFDLEVGKGLEKAKLFFAFRVPRHKKHNEPAISGLEGFVEQDNLLIKRVHAVLTPTSRRRRSKKRSVKPIVKPGDDNESETPEVTPPVPTEPDDTPSPSASPTPAAPTPAAPTSGDSDDTSDELE